MQVAFQILCLNFPNGEQKGQAGLAVDRTRGPQNSTPVSFSEVAQTFCEASWQGEHQPSTAGKQFQPNCRGCPEGTALDKAQSSSVGDTCLVAVLPVGTVHALEAAGGLPFDDALPCARQAVPAAVGERHLQEKSPSRLMVPVPFYGNTLASSRAVIAWLACWMKNLKCQPFPLTEQTHFAQ